ncbi:hypothetical protein L195_g059049, partial [Trifolium pratense]
GSLQEVTRERYSFQITQKEERKGWDASYWLIKQLGKHVEKVTWEEALMILLKKEETC